VVAIAWSFGAGSIELASVGFGFTLGGVFVGHSLYKKHQHVNKNIKFIMRPSGGGMFPEDPDDEESLEYKKRQRDESRREYRPLTNKEARREAKKLGYREVKDHPCGNTRNRAVFTNGRNFISADAYIHSGGAWKQFNIRGKLESTMDIKLKIVHKIYPK